MPEDKDMEQRLKDHLTRVTEIERPGLEARILAGERPRHKATWTATLGLVLVIVAVFAVYTIGSGNQTRNVFSNISSGLNQ